MFFTKDNMLILSVLIVITVILTILILYNSKKPIEKFCGNLFNSKCNDEACYGFSSYAKPGISTRQIKQEC